MRDHVVEGGGGLRLYAIDEGDQDAQPIVFLHGFSQCRLSFLKQFESDLIDDFRLVAMDLRGHGRSEKPAAAYGDSKLWAEDVNAVIQTLGLENPLLVGHAYGGVVIGDYLRFYGEADVSGIQLVSAITKVGTEAAMAVISPEFQALAPGLFSNSVDESLRSLSEFMRMCTHEELSETDFCFFLGFNTMVPPYVREGLFSRVVDNDDVLSAFSKPGLVTHGYRDIIVFPAAARHHAATIPGATLSLYPGVGHVPHWETPDLFDQELRKFANSLT
ncbi:MAG: alpha/beta fold hydrolase [Egibacteraceae bacterium]